MACSLETLVSKELRGSRASPASHLGEILTNQIRWGWIGLGRLELKKGVPVSLPGCSCRIGLNRKPIDLTRGESRLC